MSCGGQFVQRHWCVHAGAAGRSGRRRVGDAVVLGRVRCGFTGTGLQRVGLAGGGALADPQRSGGHRKQGELDRRFARAVDLLGPMNRRRHAAHMPVAVVAAENGHVGPGVAFAVGDGLLVAGSGLAFCPLPTLGKRQYLTLLAL